MTIGSQNRIMKANAPTTTGVSSPQPSRLMDSRNARTFGLSRAVTCVLPSPGLIFSNRSRDKVAYQSALKTNRCPCVIRCVPSQLGCVGKADRVAGNPTVLRWANTPGGSNYDSEVRWKQNLDLDYHAPRLNTTTGTVLNMMRRSSAAERRPIYSRSSANFRLTSSIDPSYC